LTATPLGTVPRLTDESVAFTEPDAALVPGRKTKDPTRQAMRIGMTQRDLWELGIVSRSISRAQALPLSESGRQARVL
jgi:hypothetical protein